ncbi:hypothetical protein ONZ45_g1921 [Pleurotus djamor]|nr:hypothetical protein ONZ45_g11821 [Pleurotus djamor]KAJ8521359.1 hypothetical protein ONZ45_g1921 [Pleurotus djamor]
MFAKFATLFVSVLATGVWSAPTAAPAPVSDLAARTFSFNNWGGHASLNNFDNFYGSSSFDGFASFKQVVVQENRVVCHAQQIEIIQQRLVILQEMAKKIITEQICEVETQTIVFQQFHASLGHFSGDLRRQSGHRVGYDSNIVSHFPSIVGSDGSLSSDNFGFSGSDVGKSTVVVGGSNWNDQSSPSSVESAFEAASSASD